MSRLTTFFATTLLFGALSAAPAAAGDCDQTAYGVVVAQDDQVKVEVNGVIYDLLDGDQMLSDGLIHLDMVIMVGRLMANPRTVVALEDTHF